MKKEQIFRQANDNLINHNLTDHMEAFYLPDFKAHAEGKTYRGHEFIRRYSKQMHQALPDIAVIEMLFFVENENTIAWQRTLQGTHHANMMGIPASGKCVTWNEMVISRFAGVQIAEEWIVSELTGQLMIKLSAK